jgi:hypothetical protein
MANAGASRASRKIGDRLGTPEVRQLRPDAIVVGWEGFGPIAPGGGRSRG